MFKAENLKVVSLSEAHSLNRVWADFTLSLVEKNLMSQPTGNHHLLINVDDIDKITHGYTAPSLAMGHEIVNWSRSIDDIHNKKLLVHCYAGISRSTAALIGILCANGMAPVESVTMVGNIRPVMWPNRRFITIFDKILSDEGLFPKRDLEDKVQEWRDAALADDMKKNMPFLLLDAASKE